MRRSIACSASRATCTSMQRRPDESQAALTTLPGEDPLVVLAGLSDGLMLPASEPAAEIATTFDLGADSTPSSTCTTAGAGTLPAPTGRSTSTPEPGRADAATAP